MDKRARIVMLSVSTLLVFCGGAVTQTGANKALIERWLEMWETADLTIADEILTADFVAHVPHYPQAGNLEGYKGEITNNPTVVPDFDGTIEDLIAEGDKVVGRFTATGTMQPFNTAYTNTWIIFFRFVDGRIAEEWWEFDLLGVQQQMGLIPPMPEGPPAMQRQDPEVFTWGTLSDVTGDPGDPEANKALVEREFAAWEQGDADALMTVLDDVYAPSFVYHDPARPQVTDLASYKQWGAETLALFPGLSMPIDDIVAEGDKVAVRYTFTGVQIGVGREIIQSGITIDRIADGQIVEGWCSADMLGAIMQMSAVAPADPGTDGLVAYYSLDADAGDDSGNGFDGTVMGDPQATAGTIGGAMEFDGDGDYIEVAHDDGLDITGAISLALWIRTDAEDPEGQGLETAPMCKALSGASPSWSWQIRYGWGSPQPYMAFTFNTSPRAWAYVGQNLEQGEWHHIACSADGETLTAYLNGQATESTPMGDITSSPTPVLIGSDGWGSDWIGGIDEVRIYNRALSAGEILFLTGYMADVTAPGDLVQGVPNDGDWPAAETPDLAIDDNVETKYLHFKGDFDPDAGPTGFRVKPSVGPTVVTGISFTTANDVPGRDPVAFALYGSNGSIDGPYTLIASRDIVDFAGAEEWPRFAKNATPIVLNNATAYTYYQVLITAIRGPVGDSVNSMQIAEVELLGMPLVPPPDVEANKEVARRFFEEMWNNRDLDLVEELVSPDIHGYPATGPFVGWEGLQQTMEATFAALPDLAITIDQIIAEDDKVALLTTYRGTHTGTLISQIPPTGAEVTVTGASLYRFVDGKLAESRCFMDMLGLMQQVGAVTPARPAPEDYAWLPGSPLTGEPGDPEVNKTMVTRFVEEVWNEKDLAPIVELFHPESFGNNPPVDYMYAPYMDYGRDAMFTQSIADYLAAIPDMHVTIHAIVAEGDKAMAHWTVNGTHGGELAGIPATGRPVTFSGHTMYRFAGGQIVETWWAWDIMGLMQQITPTEAGD